MQTSLQSDLEALYAQVPNLECARRCGSSCTTGPIPIGTVEWDRIIAALGYEAVGDPATWVCPFYKDGLCTIHDIRPMICRLWGATEDMPCPHGCAPKRVLTRKEAESLLHAVYALGGKSYWVWGKDNYERMAHTMLLTVGDRLSILQVLQVAKEFATTESNVTTLRQVRKLKEDLSFEDDEHKRLDLRIITACPNGHPKISFPASTTEFGVCPECKAPMFMERWKWDPAKDTGKEIAVGDIAKNTVANAFKQLDTRDKMREEWLPLYEKFVDDEPSPDNVTTTPLPKYAA